jgi:hypothetical protein
LSLYPNFTKDSEACKKKWSGIYNDYKEDKAMNINTTEQQSGENTSKSSEPKRKDDIFMKRCIGEIRETSMTLLESLKVNDDIKMIFLMNMQQTMHKLVEKL